MNLFELINAMHSIPVKVFATESKKEIFSAILPALYSDQSTRSFSVIEIGKGSLYSSLYHTEGDDVHSDCKRFCFTPEKFDLLKARYAILFICLCYPYIYVYLQDMIN